MSAVPVTDAEDRREAAKSLRVLFVGAALGGATAIFRRTDDPVRALHVASLKAATAALERAGEGAVDRIMVDLRPVNAAGSPLDVAALCGRAPKAAIVVLVAPGGAGALAPLPGVSVLEEPVAPIQIIRALIAEPEVAEPEVVEEAEPAAREEPEPEAAPVDEPKVTEGFETTLSRLDEADRKVWARFVPAANFLYKKAAVGVLSALFVTFAVYAAMIVFFLTSSSWSVPFELSRGHVLVEKVQRDISSLSVRLNKIEQDLGRAEANLLRAQRDRADAKAALLVTQQAIREELRVQGRAGDDLRDHISRLKKVIAQFSETSGLDYAKELERAYERRLITRQKLQNGTLQVLETMHRLTLVNNELAAKIQERDRVLRRREFLQSLQDSFGQDNTNLVVSAGSDLVHFAQDLIRTRNRIRSAEREFALARAQRAKLQDSRRVVDANLEALRATPAARALDGPVSVLFVPYTNAEAFAAANEPRTLYTCAFKILWCRASGVTGQPIEGETTTVHPLFGKPLRGTYVEAVFHDRGTRRSGAFRADGTGGDVTKELVHANRAPLLF